MLEQLFPQLKGMSVEQAELKIKPREKRVTERDNKGNPKSFVQVYQISAHGHNIFVEEGDEKLDLARNLLQADRATQTPQTDDEEPEKDPTE